MSHPGPPASMAELSECKGQFTDLRFFGHPDLQAGCRPVEYSEFGARDLLADARMLGGFLVDYRRETGLGAAVAANQIGLERSMVAFALPFVDPADTLELKDILIACNLALAGTSGSMISAESCMSSDLEMVAVVRAAKIRALYRTPDGQPLTLDQAFRPNVVQHELDHVLGFTCLQRAIPGSLRELELQGKPKAEMSRVAEEYAALYDPDLVATLYGGDVPERH